MNVYLCSHLALAVQAFSAPSSSFADLLRDESGQDMIEYALIACFIGFSTVTGINGLAAEIANYFNIVDNAFLNSLSSQ